MQWGFDKKELTLGWRPWFAWRPVWVSDCRWAWLETVARHIHSFGHHTYFPIATRTYKYMPWKDCVRDKILQHERSVDVQVPPSPENPLGVYLYPPDAARYVLDK